MLRLLWRGVAIRLGLVVLGLVPLLALEAGLRHFWRPETAIDARGIILTSIDPFERDGDFFMTKRQYLQAIRPIRFAAKKESGTFRIFCLGGSSTFGYPYEASFAWPSFLERRLRELYPDRRCEVVNLGGNSYGSSRNLGTMRAVVKYEPDLIILLAGSNEFVEDSYRSALESHVGFVERLRSLRVYQALSLVWPTLRPEPRAMPNSRQGTGAWFFSPVVSGKLYEPTSPVRRQTISRFAENLDQMADLASERRIKFLLAVQPSNLADWAPETDSSQPADPKTASQWQALYGRARVLERQGLPAETAAAYADAEAIWNNNAEFCFRHGHALLALGKGDEARRQFIRARDLDPVPVRPTTEINALIRVAAEKHGLPLVDLEQAFASASPQGVVGDDLVLDFVHATPAGNALIAREVWRAATGYALPGTAYPLEKEAAWWRRELEFAGTPPHVDANLATMWGLIYDRKGMTAQAIAMYREAIRVGPPLPAPRLNLAMALLRQGKPELARPFLEEIVAVFPENKDPFPVLAEVHRALGNTEESILWYERSLREGLTDADLFLRYGSLLVERGRFDKALAILDRGLTIHPNDCGLGSLRGLTLEGTGNVPAARDWYSGILEHDPRCQDAWQNLGVLQMNRGEWQIATATFLEALRHPPPYPIHHLNLGYVYLQLKKPAAAIEQFQVYCEFDPSCRDKIPREFHNQLWPAREAAQL